jgi:beta-lactamase regulating signal transducer with metallopeptidase domain
MNPVSILESSTVNALVWSIIHSIWQFSLIALIMSLLLKRYQNHTSNLRYLIALGSLGFSFIVSLGTFLYYYYETSGADLITMSEKQEFIINISSEPIVNSSLWMDIYVWIDQYQQPIFYTWLIGVLLFASKFVFSLGYVEFLSRTATPIFDQDAYRSFRKIINHLKIAQNVQIGESKYVKSPMILGFFKPIVLFPVGIINQLDIAEAEAILAHELAHFVRKDITVNMVQTLVEILFYYHPAIWWISTNIRVERENCCDDLAIKYLGNNIHYAKTLVKMQEINSNQSPILALNFSKKDSFFSQRIKRILNMTQTRNYLKEKILTSMAILLLVTFFTKDMIGNDHGIVVEEMNTINQEVDANIITVIDTMPQKKESITILKKTNDQDLKISMENGKITTLEVDGKKIEEKDYDKYEDIISEVKPRKFGSGQGSMMFFGDGTETEPFEFHFGKEGELDSIFGKIGMMDFEKLGIDQEKMEQQMQKMQEQLSKMNFDFRGLDSMNFDFDFPDMFGENMDPQMRIFEIEDGDLFIEPSGEFPESQRIDGHVDEMDYGRRSSNFSETLGNALNRDGLLIPNKENKVELTGKHLKINGEKQPTNIYQKYKRIFEETSGTTLEKNSKLEFKFEGKESKRKYRVY